MWEMKPLGGVMERTFNGAAAEEELGRVTKCGKSRVPSAGVPWESALTHCDENSGCSQEARFGAFYIASCWMCSLEPIS